MDLYRTARADTGAGVGRKAIVGRATVVRDLGVTRAAVAVARIASMDLDALNAIVYVCMDVYIAVSGEVYGKRVAEVAIRVDHSEVQGGVMYDVSIYCKVIRIQVRFGGCWTFSDTQYVYTSQSYTYTTVTSNSHPLEGSEQYRRSRYGDNENGIRIDPSSSVRQAGSSCDPSSSPFNIDHQDDIYHLYSIR